MAQGHDLARLHLYCTDRALYQPKPHLTCLGRRELPCHLPLGFTCSPPVTHAVYAGSVARTPEVAEQRCLDAAMAYVRRNPSSGPLELWTCKRELTLLGLSRFRWARQ